MDTKKHPKHWYRREKLRQYVHDWFSTHVCVDCGEDDPIVLQLDHRGDKRYDMSKAISNRVGLDTLKREIAKCDVVCANCHTRRTAVQQQWYRRLYVSERTAERLGQV